MKVWIAVLATLFPSLALAASFAVQSGEHDGFTRIAIRFGDTPEWTLGRVEGGYELRPILPAAEYDLADVFRLIPKTRIRSIQTRSQARLFLNVECQCHADVFEIRRGLVIDIKDGPPFANSQFEASLADLPGREIGANPVLVSRVPLPRPDRAALSAKPRRTEDLWPRRLPADGWQDALLPSLSPSGTAPSPGNSGQLAETQADLIAAIGRAATQGMLSPRVPPIPAILPEAKPPPETPAVVFETALMAVPDGRPNIRIETAIDRGQANAAPDPMTASGQTCIPSEMLDVTSWGVPPDNGAALAQYRSQLVGEFDLADSAGLLALAKNYLYLTFGVEAKSLIHTFQTKIQDADIYLALADIMDTGQTNTDGPFADQLACATRSALWSVFARPALKRGEKVARNAVTEAFAELPLHLRRHVGPGLAQRFLDIGDTDTATTIRNTIARAPGQHGERFDLMEAEIALSAGQDQVGQERLEEIVKDDGSLAPQALIRLIDSELAANRPVSETNIDNAGALAFENRGTKLGSELARAHLRAMAHSARISQALDELAAAVNRSDLEPHTANQLYNEILELATGTLGDAEFLQVALNQKSGIGLDGQGDAVRRKIVARLIGLGLPEAARAILSEDPVVPTPEDRQLYASAHLAEGNAELALGYLAGLNDPASKALRARAHEINGEFTLASDFYALLGDVESQARNAWRGKDWETAGALGTDPQRAAASLSTLASDESSEFGPLASELGPLATDRLLLEHSQTTRTVLAELLAQTDRP